MANKWRIEEIEKAIQKQMRRRLTLAAEYVVGAVKSITPYDTGDLRASITKKVVRFDTARIGTNVEYASYVEFGTIYMRPRSYLRRGLLESKGAVRKILQQ